jgi:hypothetical protein
MADNSVRSSLCSESRACTLGGCMLLRNTERFLEMLEVSGEHGLRRRFLLSPAETAKTNGFFFEHNKSVFGLGAAHGMHWLVVQGAIVECGDGLTTELREGTGRRAFRAHMNSRPFVEVSYEPMKPFANFFAMEDEDVDGFLLIHNILSNTERRAIFLRHNDRSS